MAIANTLDGELLRRRCRRDYGEYVKLANPGFYMTTFHRYLCDQIQEFLEYESENAMDILLLSVPPRHGKSFTVTETLPAWYLGKHPDYNVILCSYEGTFAESFSRRNRDKFNEYSCDVFGVEPNDKVQGVALWETKDGGRCRAAGLKGGITGYGAELFIIDDPIKNKEQAESETVIAKIHDEMGPSVQSRIHPGGKLIVIQTRWVENDVVGYIEKNWSEFIWKTINLPCECEDPATDPLGRQLGDALMGDHLGDHNLPQRIRNDNKWLRSKKVLVLAGEGEHTWNALYQGHPSAQNGNLFKDSWWKYYSRVGIKASDFEYLCLSVDATFKKTDTSDRVSMQLWGIMQKHIWLFKLVNKRMGFVETTEMIKKYVKDFPEIDELIIEDKANGPAIIAMLKHEIPGIIPIEPEGSKVARANAVTGIIESGNVYLPRYADFTAEFIEEHASFPRGVNDDLVDSCTQFLNKYKFFGADYQEDNRTQFEKDLQKFKNKMLRNGGRTKRGYY